MTADSWWSWLGTLSTEDIGMDTSVTKNKAVQMKRYRSAAYCLALVKLLAQHGTVLAQTAKSTSHAKDHIPCVTELRPYCG
jgi:hypothetical protein